MNGGYSARAARIASDGRGGAGEERRAPPHYGRGSGGRTEALVAEVVRLLAVGVWDFIGIVSVLLGLLIVLVLWIAPFVGLGLAAYYVFRGRVSRWALRALVVGIPLAVAFGLALIMGAMVLYLNARYAVLHLHPENAHAAIAAALIEARRRVRVNEER